MSRGVAIRACVWMSVALVAMVGCGKKAKEIETQTKEAASQMEQAAKSLNQALSQGAGVDMDKASKQMGDAVQKMSEAMNQGSKVEPVDFRKLKDLLPAAIGSLKRTDASGEKTAGLGMSTSEAKGSYSGGENTSINISITDMGSLSGLAAMGTAAWSLANIDRETDSGYEKTTTYGGHKAMEKYDRTNKSGDISIIVGKRFMVEIEGHNVSVEDLKAAVKALDLAKLDAMKGEGVQQAAK